MGRLLNLKKNMKRLLFLFLALFSITSVIKAQYSVHTNDTIYACDATTLLQADPADTYYLWKYSPTYEGSYTPAGTSS